MWVVMAGTSFPCSYSISIERVILASVLALPFHACTRGDIMSLDLQPLAPHRKPSTASKALFVLAAVLLLVSLALISAAVTNQVAITSGHATATAQTHATSLARAATGTASAVLAATTIAQANATATVQAQSTAIARTQAHAPATAQANVTATAPALAPQDPYPPYPR